MTYRTVEVCVSLPGDSSNGRRYFWNVVVKHTKIQRTGTKKYEHTGQLYLAGKAKNVHRSPHRDDVSALGQRHLSEFGTLFEQLLPSSFLFLA